MFANAQKMPISSIPPIPATVSISPHWSQNGSNTMPHAALQVSARPGYHVGGAGWEWQSGLDLISFSLANTVPMSQSSISTSLGGRPPTMRALCEREVVGANATAAAVASARAAIAI
eukprot:COSAG04_NODE_656_length_11493_cov_74.983247_6_plen_117_part_00